MRTTAVTGLSTLFLSSAAIATAAAAAGTVEYAIQKLPKPGSASRFTRRDTIESALLTNFADEDGLAYYLNVTVGTPGQMQTVQLDTGSSDFYFSASNATFCQTEPGCAGGTFDPSKSSTFHVITPGGFNTTFGDGSTEVGDFVTDVVQIGDLKVTGAQMGIAYEINSTVGANTALMGVGYSTNEGIQENGVYYPNFVEALVGSGAIASRLFSLYLNELDYYGSVLFGGIDTDKFSGDLISLNCLTDGYGLVENYFLVLAEVTAKPYNGENQTVLRSTENNPYYVLPDSGSTAWEIPTRVYQDMIEITGVDSEYLVRPCSDVARGITNTTHFQFTFAGNGTNTATLNLELADLFTPLTNDDGTAATDEAGRPYCVLRIQEATPEEDILVVGDAVMRAGYWVFDQDNGQVSVAQAKLKSSSSNIVAVEAGSHGLRNATNNEVAASQHNTVASTITASASYGLSTVGSTVGAATGAEATTAISNSAGGSGTKATGSASATHSKGAAAGVSPPFALGAWCLGAGLVTFWVAIGTLLIQL